MTSDPTAPPPSETGLTADEKNWGMAAHLSALAGLVIGLMLLGPLVVFLMKKDESAYVAGHAKEALNFQITMFILKVGAVVVGLLTCGIGLIVVPVLFVLDIVLTIIAGIKASEGKPYRYPFAFRLVS